MWENGEQRPQRSQLTTSVGNTRPRASALQVLESVCGRHVIDVTSCRETAD